ncbi:PREDICTED: sperm-associated antigen 7 homolog [Dinoponera quadriceps]|uniref:Sperm-associated antigen 7 homolog n=1 Tax=Dinoponera quadriceps TaxID=609295 RepID=A0A6P3WVQ3_DINQU|nr:PREDICTED: sperm-associated antigen 7 homolog [Dinoponera quadriceps]
MDLLGSILNSMDRPPIISDKQKALMKKQKEEYEKRKKAEAERLKIFRQQVEEKINKFLQDDNAKEHKFVAMGKIHRSIIYDVAEVANVLAYTFGEEDIDRYVMIFKREHAPSEDQLYILRRGEEWNEEVAKKLKEERRMKAKEAAEYAKSRKNKEKFVPNSYYKDKYQHLIGKEAALEAARKTEANNSSYGCVPSENKKDQRSIEQTLADIRAKRRKLEENNQTSSSSDNSTK